MSLVHTKNKTLVKSIRPAKKIVKFMGQGK